MICDSTVWVLIYHITSSLWVPIATYPTEDECYRVIETDFTPTAKVSCLRAEVQQRRKKTK